MNKETKTLWIVRSDTDDNNVHAEFDSKGEAITYAKDSDDAIVYEVEFGLDEDGSIDYADELSEEVVWSYADE